jgi:hypothetical protein
MNALLHIPVQLATALADASNPVDRLSSAQRRLTANASGGSWLWVVLIFLAGVLSLTTVWLFFTWFEGRRRQQWNAFIARAEGAGLSREECNLLFNIARKSSLRDPQQIFVSEAQFNTGLAKLENALTENAKGQTPICGSCAFVHSLREKLGFQTIVNPGRATGIGLGKIPQAAILSVFRQRSPESFTVAAVEQTRGGELVVEPEMQIDCHPGESWVVRYPEGGVLWEFTAFVTQTEPGNVTLRPTGELRWINRRRFVRTPTRKPAKIASFPFQRPGGQTEPPQFVAAELVEIAGPGMLLQAPLELESGDRVLVVIQLGDDRLVESVARVRHVRGEAKKGKTIAVELMGLTSSDIAELAHETNTAAHEMKLGDDEDGDDTQQVSADDLPQEEVSA